MGSGSRLHLVSKQQHKNIHYSLASSQSKNINYISTCKKYLYTVFLPRCFQSGGGGGQGGSYYSVKIANVIEIDGSVQYNKIICY